jgi:hypothetical protein
VTLRVTPRSGHRQRSIRSALSGLFPGKPPPEGIPEDDG